MLRGTHHGRARAHRNRAHGLAAAAGTALFVPDVVHPHKPTPKRMRHQADSWCSQGGYSRARPRPTLTHPLAPRRLSGGRASGSPALRYQRVTLKVCRGVLRWCALLAQRAAPHAREAGARAAVPAFFAGQWSRQGRFLALRVCSEGVGPFTHRTVHLRISTPRTRHRTESPPDQ